MTRIEEGKMIHKFVLWLILLGTLGLAVPAGAQSGSNASNYQSGAQVSVNGRTGDLDISVTLVRLPGIVSEMGLSLAMSYRSEDARSAIQSNMRNFGLPYGWSLGLSFLYNDGTSKKLNVDGTQVYQLDDGWRTSFTPVGASLPLNAKTGLMQYNRADASLKQDNSSVTVNGIGSAYIFTNLGGQVKYFSAGGLMICEADRFGNHIDYHYLNRVTGGNASETTSAANATLSEMIDTWGHTVTLASCTDPGSCVPGETRITMPDGRTMGWVAPNAYTITEIIDSEGMITHLQWQRSTCDDQSYGNQRLANMTTSVGGMTSLTYTCLDVCTEPSATECTQKTSWSVVDTEYECPNNESGVTCPAGSPNGDFLTTKYQYKTTENVNNYTGYPRYSPYHPSVAGADALMSAPDAGSFRYTTIVSKHRANGGIIHQVQTDYNFLHLQQEQRVYVSDGSSSNLMLSKETSYCYPISDTAPTTSCPLTTANYQLLPSNYQSPIIQGSCQYNAGTASTTGARRSVMTMTYDAFGNTIRKRIYHATGPEGIVSACDRATRLSTSGMRLVTEDNMQYDTPAALDADGYVDIGAGSGHFGLMLGQQSFVYLDEDDSGVGAHSQLLGVSGPVLVKLVCNELTSADSGAEAAGTNIKTNTSGLMATDAAAPTTLGVIDACAASTGSSWIAVPAPPKTTTFTYDEAGRTLDEITSWASGFTAPDGVSSTSQGFTYELSAATEDEEQCAGDGSVLQITSTDGQGYTTVNRLCTLNGFHLSATDGNGNETLMEHSANGLTTKTTHADGTHVDTQYYYACPVAQDGRTQTCPSSSTALKDCPYDSQAQKRNCTAKTMSSGPGQQSFVDGVVKVDIRDGLGRMVETLDNLGGSAGEGFTAMETTKTMTFDDRGMLVKSSRSMGATSPLVYEVTTTLDPKLRPSMVCGPRGETHQFVHDDVNQETKAIFNGSDREAYVTNDSEKLTTIANCGLMADQTEPGTSGCTTVASDMSSAECAGDAYYTYTLHDGSGQEHSLVAMAGQTVDLGASVTEVNGVSTYSADLLKYGYSLTSTNQANNQVTANSTFKRDLQGHVLEQVVTVETTTGGGAAPTMTTSTFASDDTEYNNIDQKIRERNKLSDLPEAPLLEETYTYDPVGNLETMTTYAGTEFQNYYDNRNRLVRHCFPTNSGSEGEKMVLDPVTGAIMKVTRFTNPGACSESDSGDVDVVSESYTYTRFGAIESITYSDGTKLEWAYDPYQRMACFADALATTNGHDCPDSPVAVGFSPDPSELLTSYTYYPDSDTYRRGLLQSKCRGVPDGNGGFVTKCMDTDYYTSADVGGSCSDALSGIVGAFASMMKSETYCTGGGCDDGGSLVYQTNYSYDAHRRPCLVESRNADGDVILSSAYRYDQFDNVVHEESSSDLDPSDDSNYQIDYTYDGLLRLIEENRQDLDGNPIKDTTYEYDAASNLKRKIEVEPDEVSEEPSATPTPAVTSTAPIATATSAPPTATSAPATATSQPTPTAKRDEDDGCQVGASGGAGWQLLLPLALVALLRRRPRRSRGAGAARR
jgi:hypothetical protein